jgi:hypothetical protein
MSVLLYYLSIVKYQNKCFIFVINMYGIVQKYFTEILYCYLNNSLFTTFCNHHCCPPVIVHIFELEYFPFFSFQI